VCYNLWFNAPIAMPVAGSLEAPLPGYRQPATSWVHYTISCNTQSSSPEDGRNNRPKHVELIGIINKPLLFSILFISMMQNQENIKFQRSKICYLFSQNLSLVGCLRNTEVFVRVSTITSSLFNNNQKDAAMLNKQRRVESCKASVFPLCTVVFPS